MPVDHSKNIIELKNICFAYNDEEVLHNISLNIHQGDYLGIIGPNGGGKTTLIKIMLGLLQPDKGSVTLFNTPISQFKHWEKIAYVAQKNNQFDTHFPMTVQEVVQLGRVAKRGFLNGLTEEDQKYVQEALSQVGMTHLKNRLIGDLSGGQQQRVFIARALAAKPAVIVLDEPTVGIDVNTQEEFYALLKKINKGLDITLILISHDIDVVAHEVTEIACVNKTLVYDNHPHDFLNKETLKEVYGKEIKFILHKH